MKACGRKKTNTECKILSDVGILNSWGTEKVNAESARQQTDEEIISELVKGN